ncbi:MAG: plasmid mobilization protein [Oscillospiraceae bacterium]
MGVSSNMRSSRVRRQAAKKPNKERTVQVRFSDEELAALDAICSEKKMTRSAFLRSCVEKVQGGDVEPTYVVTRNADAERMASEAKSIGVNVNQIARALNAESKSHPGSLSPGVLGECKTGLAGGARRAVEADR